MNINEEIVLSCAFKYALGRRTYVTGAVADEIIKNWDKLKQGKRELFKREIQEAIDNQDAGDDCDIESWRRILELK